MSPAPPAPAAELLAQLRDIHGLDPLPWWPPAPGWWLAAGGLLLLAALLWNWRLLWRLRPTARELALGSWRWDAARALQDLERRARAGQDAQGVASALSELLRRVAMARLGRPACAGLSGQDWLDWLTAQDPQGFPWNRQGALLLELPYAPPARIPDRSQTARLLTLIGAAQAWVRVRAPREAGGDV